VAPGVVYTTFHHPLTQANVITTDYQTEYHRFSRDSRRVLPPVAAE
jgi:hypothetical protein